MTNRRDKDSPPKGGIDSGLGGILKGLTDLVEKLDKLAETGQKISREGEIHGLGKDIKGIYGFTVNLGLGDEKARMEPFGNIRRDENSGEAVVQEFREPVVDVFEEEDYTLVVAEMPGISAKDVQLDIKDDLLTVYAERGDKKYRKEVLLPGNFSKDKMAVSCNNGILEIKCLK